MATVIIMPRQGQSVESCIITEWVKKVGDKVNEGDILFSYETDKSSFDEYAKISGTVLAILREEGDDVPCLENVCVIGEEGEDISGFLSKKEENVEVKKEEVVEKKEEVKIVSTGKVNTEGRIKISPRAKEKAENMKLDYTKAIPTGPNGRIIERDILELSKNIDNIESESVKESSGGYKDIPLSNVRKVIAKSMHESLSNMAQLTHNSSFDATQILELRKQIKGLSKNLGLSNITLNDMILYAVSRVLKDHKDVNAHFINDKIRLFEDVNLGMAVDTPRGLLVPTIFNADKMNLNEISLAAKELSNSAQDGKISPDLLSGATFTISNLGSFGVESFTPIVNPPQVAILGVNTLQTKVKVVNGQVVPYQSMSLSLTYDHRVLDGAPASRFLRDICNALENFNELLAE